MAVRKRCIRCNKKVRDDGTCQNPKCVLYVDRADPTKEPMVATVVGTEDTTPETTDTDKDK